MSFIIKGFCNINAMTDGTVSNTSPLGELSSDARTYSADKTTIANKNYSSVSAEIFSCKEDGIIKNMPLGSYDFLLQILEDIVVNFTSVIGFEEQFNSRITNAVFEAAGEPVSHNGKSLPAFCSFTATVSGEPCHFSIWFADAVFKRDYNEYEIRVLPPIPNPGDLDSSHTDLLNILEEYEYSERIDALELLRDKDPCTKVVTLKLKWVDPNNDINMVLTWTLIVFGNRGLIYDNQIQAIRDYLTQNTTKTPNEWAVWLPDLVIHSTLTIIPLWDKIALHSSGSIQYIHSPTMYANDFKNVLRKTYGRTPTIEEIDKTIHAICYYKSIGFIAYPEPNSGENSLFLDIYPDYALVALNDININRLTSATRAAIYGIEKAIRIAENYTAGTQLPFDIQVLVEGGKTYLTYNISGVTHRVLTRLSYLALQ